MTDMPAPVAASDDAFWPRLARWEWVLLAGVLVAIVVTRLPTLDQRLLEAHSFRQTFTAFQTVGFHQSGIDLLRPTIPVLGFPWTIPGEFPLFQALASVLLSWGLGADLANRVTALSLFIVAAGAAWVLIRLVAGRLVAATALVLFSFSPLALLWSRAAMIEYLALAATIGWVIGAVRFRQSSDWRWAILGGVLGSIAAAVKLTTAVVWVVPIVLFVPRSPTESGGMRSWVRDRLDPVFLSMLVVPGFLGLVWTVHADAVKAASFTTSFLTSGESYGWTFGTIAQRSTLGNLGVVLGRIDALVAGRGWLLVAIAAVVVVRRHRAFWIGMLLVPFVAVEVFFNLYLVHDYYLVAVTPALAGVLALGVGGLVRWTRVPRRWEALSVALVTILWVGLNLVLTRSYWSVAYEDFDRPGPSQEISELIAPDEYAMVHASQDDPSNWSPAVLYYAGRRGMMLADFVTLPVMASQPDLDRYRLLWTDDPIGSEVEYAALRPWFAPVSGQSLVLGTDADELGDVDALASTDRVTPGGPYEPLTLARDSLSCDGIDAVEIPAGRGSAWLSIETRGDARARMDDGRVTVPSAARTLVWRPTSNDGSRASRPLTCFGGGAIAVVSAVDTDFGYLAVTTDPPVPAQILIDGVPTSTWSLDQIVLTPGDHVVSFSDVGGFVTPEAVTVTVADGATTEVSGVFTALGWLRVVTDPAVSARISVDGRVAGESGVWVELPVGPHQVCIVDATYGTEPSCETVTVAAGETTTVARGSLRVLTSPEVPAAILVDGVRHDSWSLDWLSVSEGFHEVSFSDVEGYATPAPRTVRVAAGATTEVVGEFLALGSLRVVTEPAVEATIRIDGFAAGVAGVWTDVTPGDHQVSFSEVEGFVTPAPRLVRVTAGATSEVVGEFLRLGSLRVVTEPPAPTEISVDGVVVGEWGVWLDLPPEVHEVCFGPVAGLEVPPCETVTIRPGETAVVTGDVRQ